MANDLTESPAYRSTIERLEALKHLTDDGTEYWYAREIHALLGYPVWDKFDPVLKRAGDAFRGNGIDPSHHIAQTSKMMGLGRGAIRQGIDFFLSRTACRLIAMNGDPSKPEIAAAQAYFVVQTHRMEEADRRAEDRKRLELRDKISKSHKRVSAVAQDAGVQRQGLFHDAKYQGLYDLPLRAIRRRKGLGENEQLYDRAGPLELSANDFQMNLAADVIEKESVRGETHAITRNREVALEVREAMKRQGATLPEDLPLEEPIKEVRKREKAREKRLINDPSNEKKRLS